MVTQPLCAEHADRQRGGDGDENEPDSYHCGPPVGSCDDRPARNDRHRRCYCALPDRATSYELELTDHDAHGRTRQDGSGQPDRH